MDLGTRWYFVFCVVVGGYLGHVYFFPKGCPLYLDSIIGIGIFGLALTAALGAIGWMGDLLKDTYSAVRNWWSSRHGYLERRVVRQPNYGDQNATKTN